MKNQSLLFFLLLIAPSLLAQKILPTIKATSKNAYIIEGKKGEKQNWILTPEAKPDVYYLDKSPKTKWVSLHTDIDVLKIKIKPGQKYDFIVLLNGIDSCYTRFVSGSPIKKYAAQIPASHDTIPFILTEHQNIKLKVLLNESDSLDLKFDSGATGLVLTHEAIANKTQLLPEGTKTRDYQRLNSLNNLKIGNLSWDSLGIYPVTLSGQSTDGRFGWDLFDGRIVEINYDKNIFVVHSSLAKKPKGYSKLNIEYTHTLFCINGKLIVKGKKYKNRFLFDTGYQRALLLDSILMEEQNFPKDLTVIKTNTLRNGAGQVFYTKIVNADELSFGSFALSDVPTQLLNTANPARFKTHILGNEFLKRFNTFLDFQNNCVYLKPNELVGLPYIDAS